MLHRGLVVTFGLVTVLVAGAVSVPSAAAAPARAPIVGSGSSWSANAMANWTTEARNEGITVNYSASGSGRGRDDFANSAVDFALSDLTYAEAGEHDPQRAFATFPVTAGAIAFAYQVRVGGTEKRDIRLSGPTLAGIFSGAVTNWNDPRITADNHGHRVAPDLPITPVIRSDGSASSYRLTEWFSQRFPARWRPFSDVGATAYFPSAGGRTVAAVGSDGVINRVRRPSANGTIGYAEYSFAANAGVAVAPVENVSGHFIAPAAGNVSLALLRATVTSTGADLGGVYRDPDARAYPLSYFGYGVVPTGAEARTTTSKRQTIVDFFGYTSCAGQDVAAPLGYAPLPLNLTRAALRALATIKRVDGAVYTRALSLARCNNPTITHGDDGSSSDNLVATVPQPAPCTARDADPCAP